MRAAKKQSIQEKLLKETYFNAQSPASFGGINRLAKQTQVPTRDVKKFLSQQLTYQFHKPLRYNFPRRRYMVRGINDQWQADLVEMQRYKEENQGYRYILCLIDIFSRVAYTRPLKDKTGVEVAAAMSTVFEIAKPKRLQTDQGREFYNQHVAQVLKHYKIKLFSVYSEKKAALVERFQRTLQGKLYHAFSQQGNNQWVQLLPLVTESYNATEHRMIKMRPIEVNKSNETALWLQQYKDVEKFPKPKYNIGDVVRIPKTKTPFTKGYEEKWTDELFNIHSINTKYKPELYTLKDSNGEIIQGSFYTHELQKVNHSQNRYRIEKVIRTRTFKKQKQSLVKWKGYTDPSWIASDLIHAINE